jgi:hypothetical protein
VEWPAQLESLVQDLQITPAAGNKSCCRVDVDVDRDTLSMLNEFEARARHRQVRIKLGGHSECIRGEMNTVIGLGNPSDPSRHVGKVRISFHDMVGDDCTDDPGTHH